MLPCQSMNFKSSDSSSKFIAVPKDTIDNNIITRFYTSMKKIEDSPYVFCNTTIVTNSESSIIKKVKDMNTSSFVTSIRKISNNKNNANNVEELTDGFRHLMVENKRNQLKEFEVLSILNEDSRYVKDLDDEHCLGCECSPDEPLQELLNPNFIEALTSENQFIEFKHALGFFNKKDNAICFYFSRGETVEIKFNYFSQPMWCFGHSLNVLKLLDAGIISSRLAILMNADVKNVLENTTPVEVKIGNFNGRIRLLEIVLKKIHNLYKGSQYKSATKIRNYQNSVDYNEMVRRLGEVSVGEVREDVELLEDSIKKSIELEAGNSPEMAYIALVLCHNYKLNPHLLDCVTKRGFGHSVCGVDVDGSMYILDPWANILCEENEFRPKLESKLSKWKSMGKIVVSPLILHRLLIHLLRGYTAWRSPQMKLNH